MNDVGPAHDLGSDVKCLRDHAAGKMTSTKDTKGDLKEGSFFFCVFKGWHFRKSKKKKKEKNDNCDDEIWGADICEVSRLELFEFFGLGCVDSFKGV